MSQRNLFNWLALLRTPNVGPMKFKTFLAEDPWLNNLPEIANKSISYTKKLIEQDLAWTEQDNCSIMLLSDDDYPKLLKKIIAPPPVLFIKGSRQILNNVQIAIVGSRNASYKGNETALQFAADLATIGITITSGLAVGIDSYSHKGALSIKTGKTIAVLGQGLDIVYPKQNYQLADHIFAKGGALISEFPIGIKPMAANFPRRNRIISGLSLGVVVIEASIHSGSLITVNYALEQGREVFAVPGSIYNKNTQGCHKIIKQGAKLVENVKEIVEDLTFIDNSIYMENSIKQNQDHRYFYKPSNLDGVQTKILTKVAHDVTSIDFIINQSGLDPGVVAAELINLEFSGYIIALPGGYARLL